MDNERRHHTRHQKATRSADLITRKWRTIQDRKINNLSDPADPRRPTARRCLQTQPGTQTAPSYHCVPLGEREVVGHRVEHLGQLRVLLAYELPLVCGPFPGDLVARHHAT